jgi:hypothetical protein
MEFAHTASPEKKRITPKYLLDVCQRFSDVLANGQWFESENRKVSIKRSYTEVIGHDTVVVIDGEEVQIPEVKIRTKVAFGGEKEVVEDFDDGVALEEFYSIKAKISEVVHHSVLPAHVLSKFAEDVYLGEDEDDIEDDVHVPAEDVTPEMLDTFVFEREHEIVYKIDEEGEPFSHYIVVRYKANGATIKKSRYSWNDKDRRALCGTTAVVDGEQPLEWRLAHLTELEEADIAEFLNSFEQIIQDIVDVEQFETLQDDLYPKEDEHYKRALSIIAMAAAGFKNIKV